MSEEGPLPAPRLVAGVRAGSGLHAIRAALLEVRGSGEEGPHRIVAREEMPWDDEARELLREAASETARDPERLRRLRDLAGERLSRAAAALLANAGVEPRAVAVLGLQGPSLAEGERGESAELGAAAAAAERTGIAVISGLRPGNEGRGRAPAPLFAIGDWLLFRHAMEGRIVLRLGGTASLTALPAGCPRERAAGIPVGPGGAALDRVVERTTAGKHRFDPDGSIAARGRPDRDLLEECLREPGARVAGPFGSDWADWFLERGRAVSFDDLVATAAEYAARSLAAAIETHALELGEFSRVVLTGAGVRNRFLVGRLRTLLPGLAFESSAGHGVPPDAAGAFACALLAEAALRARLSGAAGAPPPAVLGDVVRPRWCPDARIPRRSSPSGLPG